MRCFRQLNKRFTMFVQCKKYTPFTFISRRGEKNTQSAPRRVLTEGQCFFANGRKNHSTAINSNGAPNTNNSAILGINLSDRYTDRIAVHISPDTLMNNSVLCRQTVVNTVSTIKDTGMP